MTEKEALFARNYIRHIYRALGGTTLAKDKRIQLYDLIYSYKDNIYPYNIYIYITNK